MTATGAAATTTRPRAHTWMRPWLVGALVGCGARALAYIVASLTLLAFHPRRNPALTLWPGWHGDNHSLSAYLAHLSERGFSQAVLRATHSTHTFGSAQGSDAHVWPLLPTILSGAQHIGIAPWVAGTVCSNLAVIVAASLLYCLTARLMPRHPQAPLLTTLVWLFFPFATTLGAATPLALTCALLCAAWLLTLRGQPIASGAVAALAALASPLGICGLAAVVGKAHSTTSARTNPQHAPRMRRAHRARRAAGVALALAGAATWPLVCAARFGDLRAPVDAARAHGIRPYRLGVFGGIGHAIAWLVHDAHAALIAPIAPLAETANPLISPVTSWLITILALICCLALLLTVFGALRQLGLAPALWVLAVIVGACWFALDGRALAALPQASLVAVPAFVTLASYAATRPQHQRRYVIRGWLVGTAVLWGVFMVNTTLGNWAG